MEGWWCLWSCLLEEGFLEVSCRDPAVFGFYGVALGCWFSPSCADVCCENMHSFQLCPLQGDLCGFMHSLVQGIGLGWLC